MATTITMPQLGETVTEGTVAQWLKKPGDAIEKYEAFVEVSTDKVNAEVPSPVTGILREIICQAGETVATGAPIAVIDEAAVATAAAAAPVAPATPAARPANRATASELRGADEPVPGGAAYANGSSTYLAGASSNGSAAADALRRFSPAVRRLAREHHVDIAVLSGSGAHGRVTARDVLAAAQKAPAVAAATTAVRPASQAPGAPRAPAASAHAALPGTLVPLTQSRRIIAQRMVESLANAPHAWTMVEVDVTQLWQWRAREKERFAAEKGYALTLLPFFIHAAVQALKREPLLNARFTDEGIYLHRDYNIGIAVGLERNLIVPVIREADALSIGGLAVAAGRLIEKARTGKLGPDDLAGGTFTVNNTGANGSILSKPIINAGQAAIVTMEAVVKRPVVVANDAIAIRSMMNVCLSLDHRVLDGTVANAFLGDLKTRLEAMKPGDEL